MKEEQKLIRIGTRGSPLAMTQAEMVCDALAQVYPDIKTQIVRIKTSGDWVPTMGEARLSEVDGGKGQFAKEIEKALLEGEIDAAVHSMKDMDSGMPKGLFIPVMLPREDARDVLIFSNKIKNLSNYSQFKNAPFLALPEGACVGTASVRRAAFLRSQRPDVRVVPLRGNVQTRIEKLRGEFKGPYDGPEMDCTFLALAGLKRLGLAHEADAILDLQTMLPSAGQGAVGVQLRIEDAHMIAVFGRISHSETVLCVNCEREVLRVLDGSCNTPIGVHAVRDGQSLHVRVCVASLDGAEIFNFETRVLVKGPEDALEHVQGWARALKKQIPAALLHPVLPRTGEA